jgi:hypothetical protein
MNPTPPTEDTPPFVYGVAKLVFAFLFTKFYLIYLMIGELYGFF